MADDEGGAEEERRGGGSRLADGCESVYLDIGAHRGVNLRMLFEPELYPNAEVLPASYF